MASSVLTCETGFLALGLQGGEAYSTPVRIGATLISITVVSAWFSVEKIKRLRLFFAHWLSGVVLGLSLLVDDMMVSVCWTSSNLEALIRIMKFIERSASNMLAITNLAICINLALIISSHRTMSRVKSVTSTRLIMMFLVISMALAAAWIPFWDTVVVLGTNFWILSVDEARYKVIIVSVFYVEFIVGVCMLIIMAWLLRFRMDEIKTCWSLHRRIRYYIGLTALGTAVNLGLGICGTINVLLNDPIALLFIWSWLFRYFHIALETAVLYGVLGEKNMDERSDDESSVTDDLLQTGRSMRRGSAGASISMSSKSVASVSMF